MADFTPLIEQLKNEQLKAGIVVVTDNYEYRPMLLPETFQPIFFILTPDCEVMPITYADDNIGGVTGKKVVEYNDTNRYDIIVQQLRAFGVGSGRDALVAGKAEHESIRNVSNKLSSDSTAAVAAVTAFNTALILLSISIVNNLINVSSTR
jgi:hypothetical protein